MDSNRPDDKRLPADAKGAGNSWLDSSGNGDADKDKARFQHEKDRYDREHDIFGYSLVVILLLFCFAAAMIMKIVDAVHNGATPWLMTIGTITLIVPSFLLGYLLKYVYGNDKDNDSPVKEFVNNNPFKEVVDIIVKAVIEIINAKK